MAESAKGSMDRPPAKRHAWALASCCWLTILLLTGSPLHAQPTAPNISQSPPPQLAGTPVVFSGATLFSVYDKVGSFGPQERAMAIAERLSRLAKDPLTRLDTIAVREGERTSEVVSGEVVIIAVTDGDA